MFVKYVGADTNLFGRMFPQYAGWNRTASLVGMAVDYVALIVWSKTKDGRKNRNRPRSILPWNQPQRREGSNPKAAPLSQIRERLARRHKPRTPDRASRLAALFKGRR